MRLPTPVRLHAELYAYPVHLREQIADFPQAPGVYLFHAENAAVPLYIGKSLNIRARLLAHLRTAEEARLLHQTHRLEYIQTAGEIGALLLESQLIKAQQPVHNKRLRRQRTLCSIRVVQGRIEVADSHALSQGGALYGLFKNRRALLEALRNLADEQQLCLGALGLEKNSAGRPCFRQQVGKCRGACCGLESLDAHTERLLEALHSRRVHAWPFTGAVALHERHGRLQAYHVVDQWHFFGSYKSLVQARKALLERPADFDADSYKILLRPILCGTVKVIPLALSDA